LILEEELLCEDVLIPKYESMAGQELLRAIAFLPAEGSYQEIASFEEKGSKSELLSPGEEEIKLVASFVREEELWKEGRLCEGQQMEEEGSVVLDV
jgi:hypothetical protein